MAIISQAVSVAFRFLLVLQTINSQYSVARWTIAPRHCYFPVDCSNKTIQNLTSLGWCMVHTKAIRGLTLTKNYVTYRSPQSYWRVGWSHLVVRLGAGLFYWSKVTRQGCHSQTLVSMADTIATKACQSEIGLFWGIVTHTRLSLSISSSTDADTVQYFGNHNTLLTNDSLLLKSLSIFKTGHYLRFIESHCARFI